MTRLRVRKLTRKDISVLKGVHSTNCEYPFPDLLNNLYCCNRVVEDEKGNVVGAGLVRLTSESILILDKSRPRTARVRAVKMLVEHMKKEVAALGMDETHAFVSVKDAALRSLLIKLFGFIECKDKPLYLRF